LLLLLLLLPLLLLFLFVRFFSSDNPLQNEWRARVSVGGALGWPVGGGRRWKEAVGR